MDGWRPLEQIAQLKWTLLATGTPLLNESELSALILDIFVRVCQFYPTRCVWVCGICMCMCLCVWVYMFVWCVCVCVCVCVCGVLYCTVLCVCVCVCVCVWICTYIIYIFPSLQGTRWGHREAVTSCQQTALWAQHTASPGQYPPDLWPQVGGEDSHPALHHHGGTPHPHTHPCSPSSLRYITHPHPHTPPPSHTPHFITSHCTDHTHMHLALVT